MKELGSFLHLSVIVKAAAGLAPPPQMLSLVATCDDASPKVVLTLGSTTTPPWTHASLVVGGHTWASCSVPCWSVKDPPNASPVASDTYVSDCCLYVVKAEWSRVNLTTAATAALRTIFKIVSPWQCLDLWTAQGGDSQMAVVEVLNRMCACVAQGSTFWHTTFKHTIGGKCFAPRHWAVTPKLALNPDSRGLNPISAVEHVVVNSDHFVPFWLRDRVHLNLPSDFTVSVLLAMIPSKTYCTSSVLTNRETTVTSNKTANSNQSATGRSSSGQTQIGLFPCSTLAGGACPDRRPDVSSGWAGDTMWPLGPVGVLREEGRPLILSAQPLHLMSLKSGLFLGSVAQCVAWPQASPASLPASASQLLLKPKTKLGHSQTLSIPPSFLFFSL